MAISLKGMTPQQKAAVRHREGAAIVIAIPGSGKTRIITHRIADLIDDGVRPGEILAVTFTNKAADEMKTRVRGMIGKVANSVWISTFHSMCVRMLRVNPVEFNVPRKFTIADSDTSVQIAAQAIAYVTGETIEEVKQTDSASMMAKVIEGLKRNARRPADVRKTNKKLYNVYKKYEGLLYDNQMLDFSDLILRVVLGFRERPDLRKSWSERFVHMLVDEYQDTNASQYELVKQLSSVHGNPFVVGDDDQSIYGFRDADIRNIRRFERELKAKIYLLDRNFRSTGNITAVANAVIQHNDRFIDKVITPVKDAGRPVRLIRAHDENHQAMFIVDEISALAKRDPNVYGKTAVLYRTNVQSRRISDRMTGRGMPHRVLGALTFYQRAIVKDVLAYLSVLHNPRDNVSFTRLYNKPIRKIGKVGFAEYTQAVEAYNEDNGKKLSLYQGLGKRCYSETVRGAAAAGFQQLRAVFSQLRKLPHDHVCLLIDHIIKHTRIREIAVEAMQKTKSDAQQRKYMDQVDNLDELLMVASEFDDDPGGGLSAFLEYVALMQNDSARSKEDDENRVTLMTCHRAKGTEFKHVYLIGSVEGLFPMPYRDPEETIGSFEDANDPSNEGVGNEVQQHYEEERRVFFVGMTRAEDHLTLIAPACRQVRSGNQDTMLSRFVIEARESDVIDEIDLTAQGDGYRNARYR